MMPHAHSDKGQVDQEEITTEPQKISEIWVYPIKGMQALRLEEAKIYPHGFELDRTFLLL